MTQTHAAISPYLPPLYTWMAAVTAAGFPGTYRRQVAQLAAWALQQPPQRLLALAPQEEWTAAPDAGAAEYRATVVPL